MNIIIGIAILIIGLLLPHKSIYDGIIVLLKPFLIIGGILIALS